MVLYSISETLASLIYAGFAKTEPL